MNKTWAISSGGGVGFASRTAFTICSRNASTRKSARAISSAESLVGTPLCGHLRPHFEASQRVQARVSKHFFFLGGAPLRLEKPLGWPALCAVCIGLFGDYR